MLYIYIYIIPLLIKRRKFGANDRKVLLTTTGQVDPSPEMVALYDEITDCSGALTEDMLTRLYDLALPGAQIRGGEGKGGGEREEEEKGEKDKEESEKEDEGGGLDSSPSSVWRSSPPSPPSSSSSMRPPAVQRELQLFAEAFSAVAGRGDVSPVARAAWASWAFLSLPSIREQQEQQQKQKQEQEQERGVADVQAGEGKEVAAVTDEWAEDWACSACTFLNPLGSYHCEMCGCEGNANGGGGSNSSDRGSRDSSSSSSPAPVLLDDVSDGGGGGWDSDSDSDRGPPGLVSDSSSESDSDSDDVRPRGRRAAASRVPVPTPPPAPPTPSAVVTRPSRDSSRRARVAVLLASLM